MANKPSSKFERFKRALLVIRVVTRLWQLVLPVSDVMLPWVLDRFDQTAMWGRLIIEMLEDFDVW